MLAEYGEAKNFVRFGAELTDKTKLLFLRGTLFEELIKQDLRTHLRIEEQLMVMLSLLGGYYDDVPLKQVVAARNAMLEVFRKPDFDQLRQALKDSKPEEERKPLMDAFYQALPAKPKTESPADKPSAEPTNANQAQPAPAPAQPSTPGPAPSKDGAANNQQPAKP
jgi:F-type H+-transporting ATPase subunit alpha